MKYTYEKLILVCNILDNAVMSGINQNKKKKKNYSFINDYRRPIHFFNPTTFVKYNDLKTDF